MRVRGIGVETWGGVGGCPPPNIYPRAFINIHTCSADRRDCSVYYVQPPPKTELLPTAMRGLDKKARVLIMTFELLSMDRHFTKDTDLAKSL